MIRTVFENAINRIKISGFLKSVLSLSSGVVIGQIINTVGMPVIGRLYSASDLGDYTLISARANVLMAIAVLGMLTVFMLPEKDEESRELCRLVSISTIAISTISVFALYLLSPVWKLFKTEGITYGYALLIMWVYVIFSTINNICYAYANRLRLFKVLFWNPIIGASINIGLGILFGFFGWGFIGYTVAHIISMAVNIVHLILHANPFERIPVDKRKGYVNLLKEYRRFPKYQMPANLIQNLGVQIPIEIMSSIFSTAVLGYYSMTDKIMSMPITMLATPINRVYYQEASRRYQNGDDIAEFGFKIMETNIKIAIIPISILMIFGRWIFAFVLGSQWEQSGVFAAVLGIYFLMAFCVSCLSGSFVIIGKSSWNLVCAVINVLIGVLLFVIVKLFPNISALTFLFIMASAFTLERIVEEGFFFVYMGLKLKRYLVFILRFIIIPFILAFGIQLLFNRFVA